MQTKVWQLPFKLLLYFKAYNNNIIISVHNFLIHGMIVKNELLGGQMLIFDHYPLFNIVPKFVLHLEISQSLLRNYKF